MKLLTSNLFFNNSIISVSYTHLKPSNGYIIFVVSPVFTPTVVSPGFTSDTLVFTGLAINPAIAFVRADTAASTSSFVASGLFNTSLAFSTSASTNFNDADV